RARLAARATVFGYSPAESGHSSAEALRAEGVAHVITDMAALPAVLQGWSPH
ncbi:HAD family hydrolase, partial [Paraburkholderia sp. Ac-20347]|nr:HAD family hydrolase [Paraburkholderia sp. Ac-20347]